MSKWSRLKVALLTATTAVAALQFGGCLGLGNLNWNNLVRLVVIGNLFD